MENTNYSKKTNEFGGSTRKLNVFVDVIKTKKPNWFLNWFRLLLFASVMKTVQISTSVTTIDTYVEAPI